MGTIKLRIRMEYLSTTEIAKIWGVSRKTVTRYAADGKIEGAYLVGNTWMIPATAQKEGSILPKSLNPENRDDNDENSGFHFPLYIYQNFYELKDDLKKPEEQKLYSAFEEALLGHYDVSCDIASEAFSATDNVPLQITCLYIMARCCLYENKYSLFVKHVLELQKIFATDFEHKREMRTLLIDLESYYKGFNSLLNASFDYAYDYSSESFPVITTMNLYKKILLSLRDRTNIDTTIYELALKNFEGFGYIYPSILLSSELAFIFYNQKQYSISDRYAKYAYDLARENNGFLMLSDLYSIAPHVLDRALKQYKIVIDPLLVKMTKEHKKAYIGLMLYLKKPKSLFSFINDDFDYIEYAINHYTNKEIAKEKGISENSVSRKYVKLYQSFNVNSKKDLVDAFIESLDKY